MYGGLIRLPEEFDDPAFSTVTIQRDLFYGYDTLMENVSDPSHIDFAHHKVCFERWFHFLEFLCFTNLLFGFLQNSCISEMSAWPSCFLIIPL